MVFTACETSTSSVVLIIHTCQARRATLTTSSRATGPAAVPKQRLYFSIHVIREKVPGRCQSLGGGAADVDVMFAQRFCEHATVSLPQYPCKR